LGGAHNIVAEEASRLGDSYSVLLGVDDYPEDCKELWDRAKSGERITNEEFELVMNKATYISVPRSRLYVPIL